MLIYYKIAFLFFFLSIFGSVVFFNLVKKLLLLGIAQTCVILIYLISGYYNLNTNVNDNFYATEASLYVDPIPQSLMLTAIVVGFITLSIGLGLILKIKKSFLTIEDNLIKDR